MRLDGKGVVTMSHLTTNESLRRPSILIEKQ
jgi:hypothetical protein